MERLGENWKHWDYINCIMRKTDIPEVYTNFVEHIAHVYFAANPKYVRFVCDYFVDHESKFEKESVFNIYYKYIEKSNNAWGYPKKKIKKNDKIFKKINILKSFYDQSEDTIIKYYLNLISDADFKMIEDHVERLGFVSNEKKNRKTA